MITPLDRERLRHAIFRLLLNRILVEVADQEADRGGPLVITDFLSKRMPEYARLLVDEIQDSRRVSHLLPVTLLASVDTQTLKAEIDDALGEVASQIEANTSRTGILGARLAGMATPADEMKGLCMAVGFVVLNWAMIERQLDNWVMVVFHDCDGDTD